MSQRRTIDHLEAKVETANSLIGVSGEYNTKGAITLYRAYGATRVDQYCGDSGGTSQLSKMGTIGEACDFMDGMIVGLRLIREVFPNV